MKLTHKQKILNLLKDGQWHHFRELNDICFRYSARLWDLKQQGVDHEIKRVNGVEYYRFKQDDLWLIDGTEPNYENSGDFRPLCWEN